MSKYFFRGISGGALAPSAPSCVRPCRRPSACYSSSEINNPVRFAPLMSIPRSLDARWPALSALQRFTEPTAILPIFTEPESNVFSSTNCPTLTPLNISTKTQRRFTGGRDDRAARGIKDQLQCFQWRLDGEGHSPGRHFPWAISEPAFQKLTRKSFEDDLRMMGRIYPVVPYCGDKDIIIERVCKIIKLNHKTALWFAVLTAWVCHAACSDTVFINDGYRGVGNPSLWRGPQRARALSVHFIHHMDERTELANNRDIVGQPLWRPFSR